MKRRRHVFVFCVFGLLGFCACKAEAVDSGPSGEIKVAAASDLAFAFEDLAAKFEKQTGKKVTLLFGSSGHYARQLAHGAPYDVFASADVTFVDAAISAGVCDGATKALYARGRILIWTRAGVTPAATIADLSDSRFTKVAIANPEHAPYGRAAKQALEAAGVWERVRPKIVYGENIQQTFQFAQTGNAEAAIVALSLAIISKGGVSTPIDEALHAPIDQALVVCSGGRDKELGERFAALVTSSEGRSLMKQYGFTLPSDDISP